MVKLYLILILVTIGTFLNDVHGQYISKTSKHMIYENAYVYVNNYVHNNFPTGKELKRSCRSFCVKGRNTMRIYDDVQVDDKFIPLTKGFPISDMAIKKYNAHEKGFLASIRMGVKNNQETAHILDSLDDAWKGYEKQDDEIIRNDVGNLISDNISGYQIHFSDIYKNSLAVELSSFCPNNCRVQLSAKSSNTVFFFVFDEKGEITEVYWGDTIHF